MKKSVTIFGIDTIAIIDLMNKQASNNGCVKLQKQTIGVSTISKVKQKKYRQKFL